MNYTLITDAIDLIQQFELANKSQAYSNDINGFRTWVANTTNGSASDTALLWVGKENGRSVESAISTLLVHMNKYAKMYSKSAILDSDFHSQDEFIFLIVLRSFGAMSKMELIKKNIYEKPAGMKLIDRLAENNWVSQVNSESDKRKKLITITEEGIAILDKHMDKIRMATRIVTGNLSEAEKLQLIGLLSKLEMFHQAVYQQNLETSQLLNVAYNEVS